ncbi:MAG: RNA-binding S4 domain-containing protein [Clostridiales Family XIII bacterium]|jgi:ribosomal 50S subunit-recycling heat shock protein|nr:RNA-binding S4 domain-containing protein [Clostridiales Family XIII bacterium]
MRLDKFLKVARIIKRRTVAKEACDAGRVSVNGRTAKAGYEVAVGDELTVRFGTSVLKLAVTDIADNVRKEDAADMYEIISRERTTEL